MQQVQVHDSSCVARGKSWKSNCKACPNGMTEEEEIQLTLNVEPGMIHGDTVKFDQVRSKAIVCYIQSIDSRGYLNYYPYLLGRR